MAILATQIVALMTKLKRQNEEISINTKLWAGTIGVIEEYGWKPNGMRISYLANNKQVSEDDAKNISIAAGKVVDAYMLGQLHQRYSGRIDINEVLKVAIFTRKGSFVITN